MLGRSVATGRFYSRGRGGTCSRALDVGLSEPIREAPRNFDDLDTLMGMHLANILV